MKHEYHEGPKAHDRFKELATAVFRAPKSTAPAKKAPKKSSKG